MGIFSDTFDPVHEGHISFAQAALQQAKLDKVVFIAEPSPRRKQNVTDFKHRQNMLEIRLQQFESQFEMLSAPRLKVHTIKETFSVVSDTYGQYNRYSLLMGGDVFEHIEHWGNQGQNKSYQDFIKSVSFIVALRTGDDRARITEVKTRTGARVTVIESTFPSYSSRKIRDGIRAAQTPRCIHAKVYAYIKEHGLYLGSNSD